MNKIKPLYVSAALNVALLTAVIAMALPEEKLPEPVDLSIYTQQDLTKSLLVERGMNKEQVISVLGSPALKEILDSSEEWHYCKTGELADEYVVVSFKDNVVSTMSNYTVSWLDVVFQHTQTPTEATVAAGGYGDCKLTAKMGTYKN